VIAESPFQPELRAGVDRDDVARARARAPGMPCTTWSFTEMQVVCR
jgi:hypothetical protein